MLTETAKTSVFNKNQALSVGNYLGWHTNRTFVFGVAKHLRSATKNQFYRMICYARTMAGGNSNTFCSASRQFCRFHAR